MKFKDFKYERPDIDSIKEYSVDLFEKLKKAKSFEEFDDYYRNFIKKEKNLLTMESIASIRYTIDTEDEFYNSEKDYFDENSPKIQQIENELQKIILNSNFKEEFKEKYGEHVLNLAEVGLKTFNEDIIEELKEENKLNSKYVKLLGSVKVNFEGQERNLSQMRPFMLVPDRSKRKEAMKTIFGWFDEHQNEFDDIYDQLVKVRDKMAKKLGYDNFIELAYYRLSRTDYNAEDVANYRKQVEEFVVPVASELRKRQKERINLDKLYYYDEDYSFEGGNPKPEGSTEEKVNKAQKMYKELSKETEEFFNFMVENELMDLDSKKGKTPGGYCTFIFDYDSPFIFSNFNGTSGDVDVLTHEAGHAFQSYQSRHIELPELLFPTLESAEIHSMSMEFITYPWWDLFYGEQTEKAKFMHLSEALLFIPYGVSVDEFQHWVYENPEATPESRRKKWSEIEKKYLPERDYDGVDYLVNGGFWQKQSHIYESPFYYIDYTLAQICAFQFFKKFNEDRKIAWEDYLRLCKAGGSKPFTGLINIANLKNPFKDGSLKETIDFVESYLNKINDKTL
ncbi:M3 family oligoendopeptidase [Oceanotoga teriensis]|uniref:M3 family oligoendopeptidase n=1 Tax=Oceanotoga teriensis TaxID=515440 RepID=A0AA45C7P1_9BACT|nr:M3 family oligoendopeptidase [Oceanotoga teriensis]PWJ95601.1 M3 family oligoendopeptidase [Oceanotoga teriensis]